MSPARQQLCHEIERAFRALSLALHAGTEPHWLHLDLTTAQLKGLFLLDQEGPLTIGDLAAALRVGKPAASVLVDRLVQLGLVQRHEDPADRRRTFARLCPSGEEQVARLREGRRERIQEWLGRLDDDDLAALARGLRALAAAATADEPAAATRN